MKAVVKYSFLLIFFVAVLPVFGQKAAGKKSSSTVIHVTAAQLNAAKNIKGIIPGVPDDCQIFKYKLALNINGHLGEFICAEGAMGTGFSEEMHGMFSALKPGRSFFIEDIDSTCSEVFKTQSYKFILD